MFYMESSLLLDLVFLSYNVFLVEATNTICSERTKWVECDQSGVHG